MKLSERVADLRHQSTCASRETFAARVGISVEGLRLIEVGKRVPKQETLEKILDVAQAPKHVVENVLEQGVNARQAKQHSSTLADKNEAGLLAAIGAKIIANYLDEMDWNLPADWGQEITKRMEATFVIAIQTM